MEKLSEVNDESIAKPASCAYRRQRMTGEAGNGLWKSLFISGAKMKGENSDANVPWTPSVLLLPTSPCGVAR